MFEYQDDIRVLFERVDLESAELIKDLSFEMKKEHQDLVMVLGAEIDGKALLSIMIGDSLIKEKGLHAGELIKELAKEIKGGGGGQLRRAGAACAFGGGLGRPGRVHGARLGLARAARLRAESRLRLAQEAGAEGKWKFGNLHRRRTCHGSRKRQVKARALV
ncbi:MAG: hypothetical protein IIC53_06245 [Proteobacteria bacterium]|nr:hypothetical protein [Pseudomonadota bacterium]